MNFDKTGTAAYNKTCQANLILNHTDLTAMPIEKDENLFSLYILNHFIVTNSVRVTYTIILSVLPTHR